MTRNQAVSTSPLDASPLAFRRVWRYAPLFMMLPLFSFIYRYTTILPGRSTLNHDEMWGATNANLSFFDAMVFTLRFDVHPPLYYAQLNLWALAGHSDKWLQANSAVWLLGSAIIAFYLVAKKWDGLSAAITAAFILSCPMLIGYSVIVRMYTFLSFLTLAGLMASENILERISDRSVVKPRQYLVLFLIQITIMYSHSTGIIIVIANFLYIFLAAWKLNVSRSFFVHWMKMNIALGFLALPAIANSFLRQVSHPSSPGLADVFSSLTQLIIGKGLYDIGISDLILFVIVLLLFGGAASVSVRARNLIGTYCVFPIAFGFVASHVLRPMWLTYVFLFCVPVAFVAVGDFIGMSSKHFFCMAGKQAKSVVAVFAGVIVILQTWTGIRNASSEKLPNYPIVVADLKDNVISGDCVVAVNTFDVFWGLSRYLAGTGWNEGLQIQAPPMQRWKTIMAAIPSGLAHWLDLVPRSDRFNYGNIQVIAGYPTDIDSSCQRAFFVGFSRDFESVPAAVRSAPLFEASGPLMIRGPLRLDNVVRSSAPVPQHEVGTPNLLWRRPSDAK